MNLEFEKLETECRCPTCGTVQSWQNECRRCHTNLVFLRQIADEIVSLRRRFFHALKTDDRKYAQSSAMRLIQISPTLFHQSLLDFVRK